MPPVPPLYEEWRPPSSLAPLLACVWVQRPGTARAQRVVPDGCVDLIWVTDGTQVRVEVAGPDTGAYVAELGTDTAMTGVRFRPGAAADVLGLPLHALRDERVPLAELWGRDTVEAATDAILASPRPEVAAAAAVGDRLSSTGPDGPARTAGPGWYDGSGPALAETLASRAGPGTVRLVAEELGLSERQLHRRCLVAFGYGPKTLERVLRFQEALRRARLGHRLADVAATVGYADQAHMSREVRTLAGVSIKTLLAS
jgi:AraC-like DNA-binding protein